jgi:tetratricopeptide (TPR) repeat protein
MPLNKVYILATVSLFASVSVTQAQNKIIDSLYAVLQTLPSDTNRVNCLNELAVQYGDNNVFKSIEAAHEALTIAKLIDFERGMADAYGSLGAGYSDAGNYSKAVEYLLNALHIAERRNDLSELARNYHDIGTVYTQDGNLDKGMQYYQKAVEIWKRIGNKRGPVTALYNMGHAYQQQNKDTLALQYYEKVIQQGKETDNNAAVLFSYVNISTIYLKLKNYTLARHFCDEALKLVGNGSGVDNVLAEIYGVYSEIYLAEGETQQALAIATKGLTLAESARKSSYILQNYWRLANIYQHMGNYSKAYEALSRYTILNDSLKNESNKASIEQMVSGYELEKKDMQLAAQMQQYESGIFRRNAFIALLACLLLLTFMTYNRTKLLLAAKQQQLKHHTQSLLEKSMIISSISGELDALRNSATTVDENMEKFGRILQLKIHTDEEWENFKKAFDEVYPSFFNNLRYKYPGITAAELRLAAITKLNLSVKEAATMLGISTDSVKQSRYRLKKRIGVPEDVTLKGFLEAHV